MKVLEARERVGGRVWTVPFGHTGQEVTDLGASWIHGRGPSAYDNPNWKGQMNPIYEIAKDNAHVDTVVTWEGDRDP